MSMNSFSFKARHSSRNSSRELDETMGLLNLDPEGKILPGSTAGKRPMPSYKQVDLDDLRKHFANSKGRRSADRYELQLIVLIADHTKSFRTQSKNISTSGILLEDFLPTDFSNTKSWFDIVLIQTDDAGNKRFCLVRGKTVASNTRTRRIQFDANFKNPQAAVGKFLQDMIA